MTQQELAQWAACAKRGDAHAFAMLYQTVYQDLYRLAYFMLGDRFHAEDAVSEAVLNAYLHIGSLRKAESFKGWMTTIVSNVCRRKLWSMGSVPLPDHLAAREASIDQALDLSCALGALTKEERMVVCLSVLAGYTSKEISRCLRRNQNTVRSIKASAMKKLQRALGAPYGGQNNETE